MKKEIKVEMKVEVLCAVCKNIMQERCSICADSAVLTVQCNAQSFFKLCQGAEEGAIQASLVVGFFWGFYFYNQPNQHSEGVVYEME